MTDRLKTWLDKQPQGYTPNCVVCGYHATRAGVFLRALRAVVELCDDSWPSLLKPSEVRLVIEKEVLDA